MNFYMHFLKKEEGCDNFKSQTENQCETATFNLLQQFIETLKLSFKWYEHIKSVLDSKCFPSFCVDSDFDCILSFKYRLLFLKKLGSSEVFQLQCTKPDALKIDIDSTHFFNFNSLRCSQFCSKSLQRFCTTATKVILPSTTYKASAVDNFALYVLLTNFCS